MIKKMVSLVLVFAMTICFGTTAMASPYGNQDMSYEDAYRLATIINDNIEYIEENQKIVFNESVAIAQGLDQYTATQLDMYLEGLDEKEAAELFEDISEVDNSTTSPRAVPAIIVAAGKILIKAGLTWLATKLYEWGAEKFCEEYRDYNSVTQEVCDFLGH